MDRAELAPTWAQPVCGWGWKPEPLRKASRASRASEACRDAYREIDHQLRSIAKKKAGLEIEEAKWLREAERLRVWRKLGFSTALEYLEDVFGYAPRTAMERLRVAKELGELDALEAEVRDGVLPWSAAKELSRVMTRDTQAAWLAAARGKNLRDIEELVAGHKKGDDPESPKDPDLLTRKLVIELLPRVEALMHSARVMFEAERGESLDDAAVIEAAFVRALDSRPAAQTAPVVATDSAPTASTSAADTSFAVTNKAPRPMHRTVMFKCDECLRGWRQARGRLVELPAADVELAACDAEVVTAVRALADDEVVRTENGPARMTQRQRRALTIPKATRDLVWRRDHGRCRVPGCRATRNLACHHIVFRSRGGDNEPANLILMCDGHHKLLHDGLLSITGRAPDQLTFTRSGQLLADAKSSSERAAAESLRRATCDPGNRDRATDRAKRRRFDDVVKLEHVKQGLMQLGFKARAARTAAEAACAHVGADADVGTIVKAALQLNRHETTVATARIDEATQALVQAGYPRAISRAAVESASAHVGADRDLASLICEALRRCQ
ncbi:MAG TPA: HNH endonuclease signature motif containing protein [Kofleriaceae bacterium]